MLFWICLVALLVVTGIDTAQKRHSYFGSK